MKLKAFLLISFFLFLLGTLHSQTAPNKYWIKLTDKTNTPYTINNPSDFLSSRAIQRRIDQGIPVKTNDLPVDPAYIDSLESIGLEILNMSKWFNSVTVYADSIELINLAQAFPFVAGYQKVLSLTTFEHETSILQKETNFMSLPPPLNITDYGYSTNQVEMLNCHILHNENYRGAGIHIAVLDAGFYHVDTLPAFDSLWINNRILGTRDFVDGDNYVFDGHTHGMMVLSCMGSNIPGELVGTAPEASYWLLRSEDGQTEFLIEEDNWVAAAEFADSVGADILNTSLGYTTFNDPAQNHTYADMDGNTTRITIASDIAASKGMLIVNSAGNSGSSSWHYIGAPADGDSVLAIGAVDAMGNYASFSSTGPSYDGRIKPNVTAQGHEVAIEGTNGSVTFGSGTSFSSPILAGAAACLWQAHPNMSNMELFYAIQLSGDQFMNPDSLRGYGIPNFAQAHLILNNIEYTKFEEEAFFRVSPNPFTSDFKIEMYYIDSQEVAIDIYNLQGKNVFNKSFDNFYPSYHAEYIYELEHIPAGVYIVRITTIRNQYNIKLIKG